MQESRVLPVSVLYSWSHTPAFLCLIFGWPFCHYFSASVSLLNECVKASVPQSRDRGMRCQLFRINSWLLCLPTLLNLFSKHSVSQSDRRFVTEFAVFGRTVWPKSLKVRFEGVGPGIQFQMLFFCLSVGWLVVFPSVWLFVCLSVGWLFFCLSGWLGFVCSFLLAVIEKGPENSRVESGLKLWLYIMCFLQGA